MKTLLYVLKKVGKALFFPHMIVMICFIPAAALLLVCTMNLFGSQSIPAYIAYAFSTYTLTVWCCATPKAINLIKKFKSENQYAVRLQEDVRLRVNISLYGSFIWNAAYAVFQLGLGLYHSSFWYYSMAGYYISLAFMRFFLLRYTTRHKPGEEIREELYKYRICGWVFLVMNLAITLMIFFMVYWNRTFTHHEITTIAMATYTFVSFTTAIVNMVRYRKYNSPVFSASKAISLAAACVSMITLTSTMLTTFGESDGLLFRRIILGSLGAAVSVFIIAMAIYMIVRATRTLKKMELNSSET